MNLEPEHYASPRWSWEILDCAMPMTFDTYSNCAHQCVYCFAYFQRAVGTSADDYLHHKVKAVDVERVKRMFLDPDKHTRQFAWYIKRRLVLQWGGLSDGFDWYERKFRKSLELLRFFREIDYPISISTKGVWWLYDPDYREVLRGAKNIHLKVTIITPDAGQAQALEAGTPTPDERFRGLEEAANLGVMTTLRFRPYILGVSDRHDEAMLRRAKEVGCYSSTTEFLCLESRSSKVAAERYRRISEVAGFDVWQFYRMNSSNRTGLLRLNYDLKRPHIHRMQAVSAEINLPFFVSDAHHKEASAGSGCCGLPDTGPLSNYNQGQYSHALQIAKERGQVGWADMEPLARDLGNIQFYRAEGYNAGTTRNRANRRYQTMYDYMRETWNRTESMMSPARYFGGALVPTGVDPRGDVIYTYNRPWIEQGLRVENVAALRAQMPGREDLEQDGHDQAHVAYPIYVKPANGRPPTTIGLLDRERLNHEVLDDKAAGRLDERLAVEGWARYWLLEPDLAAFADAEGHRTARAVMSAIEATAEGDETIAGGRLVAVEGRA